MAIENINMQTDGGFFVYLGRGNVITVSYFISRDLNFSSCCDGKNKPFKVFLGLLSNCNLQPVIVHIFVIFYISDVLTSVNGL